MPSQKNINQVQQIARHLQQAQAVYLIDYQGINANDITRLRQQIRQTGGQLVVIKNSLFRLALHQLSSDSKLKIDSQQLSQLKLTGTSAALFAQQDEIQPLKTIVKYAKEHEVPQLKLGFLNNQILSQAKVAKLAQLPSQIQLRAQVVNLIHSPITRLVFTIKGNLQKLAVVIHQIKEQKQNSN